MPNPKAYLGIDPGNKGAMCILIPPNKIYFIENNVAPMVLNTWLLSAKKTFNIQKIMIEKVHAIYGTSAGSNFKFGYNTGGVNFLAEASGMGVDHVTPKTWQKSIGVTKKGKAIKKEVGEICQKLYPTANVYGPRGGLLDGRSDALMIAHYCYLKYTGK